MIIRTVFGESSDYLKDLQDVVFYPGVYPTTEQYLRQRWESGKQELINLFTTMDEDLRLRLARKNVDVESVRKRDVSGRVFVVHGHNNEMKLAAARTLEALGLQPIILHEQPDQGRTVIEKFTHYADVGFALVLLSPDDTCSSKSDPTAVVRSRARQNVIFEWGFFVAAGAAVAPFSERPAGPRARPAIR